MSMQYHTYFIDHSGQFVSNHPTYGSCDEVCAGIIWFGYSDMRRNMIDSSSCGYLTIQISDVCFQAGLQKIIQLK